MSKIKITNKLICGDCLEEMRQMPKDSVDLVFGSPPYEDARTYGIDFNLKGQEWVDWMVEIYKESLRICKGLVSFVVQGRTRKFRWSATPALLMADLHRAGIHLREGPYYHRSGIPGSGGPDWLRHELEYIVSATNGGRLPWSDNVACGDKPLYRVGGLMSHRHKDGKRHNRGTKNRTVHKRYATDDNIPDTTETLEIFKQPKIANPGNLIHCKVGGGHLGSKLAHENEAPFPEKLAEFMIKSFCPPGGTVLDPFGGSGTVAAVAKKLGRHYIIIDIRQSQIKLTRKRLVEVKRSLK